MHSAKRYLVGLTSAAMVLATVAAGGASASAASQGSAPFSDISGLTQAPAISFLASAGIVNGVGGGLFDPSAPVTRAEMAKIVVNLAGKSNIASALAQETPGFVDAARIPSWAWGYVNVAQDMGIIQGYPSGKFHPNQPVTDVQAAAMLLRAVGDNQTGVVQGTWPGNYVAAAFQLGLTNGVNFVANLPATRADTAQMAYDAAVNVPVAVPITVNGTTTWCAQDCTINGTTGVTPSALYTQGSVNGYQVYTGTVTGTSTTGLTLNSGSFGTKDWASSYQLYGATNLSNLVGLDVTAMVNPNGHVNFVNVAAGATSQSGTLATSLPSGASNYTVNGINQPFLISINGTPTLALSSGTNVTLATYASTYGTTYASTTTTTQYYVNAPSTGPQADVNAAGQSNALVPDATYMQSGDSVTYVLNSSSQATAVYDTHNTIEAGIVTTTCTSSCTNPNSNITSNSGTVTINYTNPNTHAQGTETVAVQPYTSVSLNGSASSLSALQANDVVYVNIVGGDQTNGYAVNGNGTQGSMGDGNAAAIAAFRNTVTGTLEGVTTSNGNVTSLSVQPSSGSAQTLNVDSTFNSSSVLTNGVPNVGSYVQVLLDQSGNAAAVVTPTSTLQGAVALVTGAGQTVTTSGNTYTVTVSTSSGSQTLNVATAWPGSTFISGTYSYPATVAAVLGAPAATNGVVTSTIEPMTQIMPPAQGTDTVEWQVVAEGSTGAVIQAYDTTTGQFISGTQTAITNGNAFHNSGASLGFGSLANGNVVNAYSYTTGSTPPAGLSANTTYWVLLDQSQ